MYGECPSGHTPEIVDHKAVDRAEFARRTAICAACPTPGVCNKPPCPECARRKEMSLAQLAAEKRGRRVYTDVLGIGRGLEALACCAFVAFLFLLIAQCAGVVRVFP